MKGHRTSRRVAALTVGLVLALAGSASASSLVYIKDGNVWLAAPDGSSPYQVTTDGTTADPYYRPSQSADGTIVAARGSQPAKLYRLKQNGDQLNAPFATSSPTGNLLDAEISPDGKTIAYSFVTAVNGCAPPYSCGSTAAAVAYTYADHLGDPGGGLQQNGNWHWISWAGNSRTILTSDSNLVYYDDLGGGDNSNSQWFDECTAGLSDCSTNGGWAIHDGSVSADGRKVAWIWRSPDPDPYTTADEPYLQLGTTAGDIATGTPPAAPSTPACNIGPGPREVAGQETWDRPTFAPDGGSIAWAEADGIHVTTTDMSNNCANVSPGDHLAIAGGAQPFWGPADVNPGPRSSSGGGGTTSGGGTTDGGGGTGGGGGTNGGGGVTTVLPKPAIALKVRLKTVVRKRVLPARCSLSRAGTCSLRFTISGSLARKLHLTRSRKAKTYTLARGKAALAAAGRRTVKLRLSRRAAKALRHLRSLRGTLVATAIYSDGTTHASKRVKLR